MRTTSATTRSAILAGLVAIAIVLVVNEVPLYQRNGGPILVRFGVDRAIHVGDVLVAALATAVVLAALRRRPGR